jgi:hypothetical protein
VLSPKAKESKTKEKNEGNSKSIHSSFSENMPTIFLKSIESFAFE